MKRLIPVVVLLIGVGSLWLYGLHAQDTSSQPQASTPSAKDSQASIDQSVALLRQDLRSARKQTIAGSLQLTDAEATKFWPVYDRYSAELSKLGDQRYALIKDYASGFGTLADDLTHVKLPLTLSLKLEQGRSHQSPRGSGHGFGTLRFRGTPLALWAALHCFSGIKRSGRTGRSHATERLERISD